VLPLLDGTGGGEESFQVALKGGLQRSSQSASRGTLYGPLQEVLLPFFHIIALQVMAYYLGETKGLNVDVPPTKAKQMEILESLEKGRRPTDQDRK